MRQKNEIGRKKSDVDTSARILGFPDRERTQKEMAPHACKRVLAWPVSETMKTEGISKKQMAERMNTRRSQIERSKQSNVPLGMMHETATCSLPASALREQ